MVNLNDFVTKDSATTQSTTSQRAAMADCSITTEVTKLLGIKHPIILAGMFAVSGAKLAAAVSNAGGLGVIGGLTFSPRILKISMKHVVDNLVDKSLPFGVDFAFPKIGGGARKTNYDYSKGKIDELIDIIIELNQTGVTNCRLLVAAIGIPPKHIIDRLHKNNILVMNMVGHPKHVFKALDQGVDLVCAQGTEGGGHTGNVATSILLPRVVDLCNEWSRLNNKKVYAVGAGGVYDGRGLAMTLSYGCEAAWVGTRFVACQESDASHAHKQAIVNAGHDDTGISLVYSGRPLRLIKTEYTEEWANNRQDEMKKLLEKGVIPVYNDFGDMEKYKARTDIKTFKQEDINMMLSGQVAGNINDLPTAGQIVKEMVEQACQVIKFQSQRVSMIKSKL